jgi:hypothetical protein
MPKEKAQRNFTDPESRIMPDGAHKGSFVQAYNAQAAVDSAAQIVVAAERRLHRACPVCRNSENGKRDKLCIGRNACTTGAYCFSVRTCAMMSLT